MVLADLEGGDPERRPRYDFWSLRSVVPRAPPPLAAYVSDNFYAYVQFLQMADVGTVETRRPVIVSCA